MDQFENFSEMWGNFIGAHVLESLKLKGFNNVGGQKSVHCVQISSTSSLFSKRETLLLKTFTFRKFCISRVLNADAPLRFQRRLDSSCSAFDFVIL